MINWLVLCGAVVYIERGRGFKVILIGKTWNRPGRSRSWQYKARSRISIKLSIFGMSHVTSDLILQIYTRVIVTEGL